MSAADTVLDRLVRVRQVRPNSWMAACPCCQSRRGRPLAVTDPGDGRVLLHAFCGCQTADVLASLGLELGDLFDQPLVHSIAAKKSPVPASDVLNALALEATTLAVIASDMLEGRPPNEETWTRLSAATSNLTRAANYINERS